MNILQHLFLQFLRVVIVPIANRLDIVLTIGDDIMPLYGVIYCPADE